MKGITVEKCASSVVSGWVSLFGSPSHVYCDRSSQFTRSTWEELILFLREPNYTMRHPQAQGIVKRVNRTLKKLL